MKCELCGRRARTADGMCIDCYLDCYLPTKVNDRDWVFIEGPKRENLNTDGLDLKLQLAVTFLDSEISRDKQNVVLEVEGKRVEIAVTVEDLDALARKSGVLIGKWLVFRGESDVDRVWKRIAKSTFEGELGRSAKVSTALSKEKRYVICVYTDDYLNFDDVMRVRAKLRTLGLGERLCYKPDLYTYLGIYEGTTSLNPYRYRA